jgi:hypothetical protein
MTTVAATQQPVKTDFEEVSHIPSTTSCSRTFVAIPRSLIERPKGPVSRALILAVYAVLQTTMYDSVPEIAKYLGVDKKSVYRAIASLEDSEHLLVNRSAGVANRYTFPPDDGKGWVMLPVDVLKNAGSEGVACWQAVGVYIATRKFENRISGKCDPGLRTLAQLLHTSQAKILASIDELERINAYQVVRTDARVVPVKGGRAFRSSRNRYIFPKPTSPPTSPPAEAELEGTTKHAKPSIKTGHRRAADVPFEEDIFDRSPITAAEAEPEPEPEPEERDSWTAIPEIELRWLIPKIRKFGLADDGDRKRTFGALRMGYRQCGEDPEQLLDRIEDGAEVASSLRGAIFAGIKRQEMRDDRCR